MMTHMLTERSALPQKAMLLLIIALLAGFLGIGLLIAGMNENRLTSEGFREVSYAFDLYESVGERIKINANISFTGINKTITIKHGGSPMLRNSTRYETSDWYLYVVEFADEPVAFRSIHSDVSSREAVYGEIVTTDDVAVQTLLLSYDGKTDTQYAIAYYNEIAAEHLFMAGGVCLVVALAVFILWAVLQPKRSMLAEN